ncbi:41940_t:CDS:2 [Gigaspora margarita]|uniref:41940_t:CDS:1 n=1 Tax=Gigaspora margarita TaxID=4874 RepID=A0ABN7V0E1_GIGMA|nr:41940_t:CDS:2 [Gigaspora margarita]
MLSYIALLAVIITVKNNNLSFYGLAKYKVSEHSSCIIRFKYFFSNNSPLQFFTSNDLALISSKCVVEKSEQCMTISYASIINNNLNCEFNLTEYNSVTGSFNIKMDMTILYPIQSTRFKHLGSLGSNIRVANTYLVSGLFRFSDSGKIIIEASDIDYSKSPLLTFNTSEISSFSSSNTHSIFDIIANDIDSVAKYSSKKPKPSYIEHNTVSASSSSKTLLSLTVIDIEANSFLKKKNYIKKPFYKEHNTVSASNSSKILPSLSEIDIETNSSPEKKDNIDLNIDSKNSNIEYNSEHKYSENKNLFG